MIKNNHYRTHVIGEKMGKCPFQKNNPAFCSTSQTNYENAYLLKLDFLKIKLPKKKNYGAL